MDMTHTWAVNGQSIKLNGKQHAIACEFSINPWGFFHWTICALLSKIHTPYQEIGHEPNESRQLCGRQVVVSPSNG
jgi:hypothetical protein